MRPTTFRVERYRQLVTERTPGYLPVQRTLEFQRLVQEHPRWWGFGVSSRVIATEQIPEHVVISLGCFGDTGGWRSQFADYINAQRKTD